MPKNSRYGGPSYVLAEPGDTATDALQRESALHPDEQNALTPQGNVDESEWLRNKDGYDDQGYPVDENDARDDGEGDDLSRGDNASPSSENDARDDGEGDDLSRGDNSSPSSGKHANSDDRKPSDGRKRVQMTESHSVSTSRDVSDAPLTDGDGTASQTGRKPAK